jgi:Fe-S cluster biogenesis protein NfuA
LKEHRLSVEQIEGLVKTIEELPDPTARASAIALMQSLMDFHGEALDRLMEIVAAKGASGYEIFDDFSSDEKVSSLLLLYGLHPEPLETRVMRALEKVRPSLDLHGGNVELIGINDGVVRLRLMGSCKGCPSSSLTLKMTIEESIFSMAPDVLSIETESEETSQNGFVQIGKTAKAATYTDCEIRMTG